MADPVPTPANTDPAPTPAAPVLGSDSAAPTPTPATTTTTDPAPAPANPAPAADPKAEPTPAADPKTDPAPDPNADPAPIEYTAFVVPEGITLDEELVGEFKTFAATKKLTQEEAQSLIDLNLKLEQKKTEAYRATQKEWIETAKADKEYGGSNYDQNLAVANLALDAFGTPELVTLLRTTGFGNHPEVIRTFVKIGKAVGEDKLVVRDPVSRYPGEEKSLAQRLYPNMNP